LVLVPIDRATISLVWSDSGYPCNGAYRDYHRLTIHHHNPWSNDGGAYDHDRACALAREHAADFVARTIDRLREAGTGLPGGGLVVCALDTELLGHWWYEGVVWLRAVVQECSRQGLELLHLDDALERCEPLPVQDAVMSTGGGHGEAAHASPNAASAAGAGRLGAPRWECLPASSWGQGGDLSTWSGPRVAEMAFDARAAELGVVAAGVGASATSVRELLALQASDWPFMVSRDLAVPYARERFDGHLRALEQALTRGEHADATGLRNIAAAADPAWLLAA
jgi:1,4-alpha-glucan branching enzyme